MRVLFLTHRLPYAPNRGDRLRAWFLLEQLRGKAQVDVVSLVHDAGEASQATVLLDRVASVRTAMIPHRRNLLHSVVRLPTSYPTTHSMLDAPDLLVKVRQALDAHRPDVVLAYCSGMARLAMMPPLDTIPFVLDMVDVDSAKWTLLSKQVRAPMSWIYRREAWALRRFEGDAASAAAATFVVTPGEREALAAIASGANIAVVPNGVDVDSLRPRTAPADSLTVVFCGVMDYAPNEQAASLLAREVWPLVMSARPDARLQIVGAHPSPRVQALAAVAPGIEVTGAVPDVRPYLWTAALAAAPILTARGIQNKVLEAVAAGLPTVVTPNIMASLPETVRRACVAASTPAELAGAILSILDRPPAARRAIAERADISALTWERQLRCVLPALREAVACGRTDR